MKSIKTAQFNITIAENQDQYETVHAHIDTHDPAVPITICMELTDDEIAQIVKSKKLYYRQLTFGQMTHPFCIMVDNPIPETES